MDKDIESLFNAIDNMNNETLHFMKQYFLLSQSILNLKNTCVECNSFFGKKNLQNKGAVEETLIDRDT